MTSARQLAVAAIILAASISLTGQTQPNLENGFKAYGSYDAGGLDSVNLMNGNLVLHIPMPFSYPQRGGRLTPKNVLTVNSKAWKVVPQDNGAGAVTYSWSSGFGPVGTIGEIGTGIGLASTFDMAVHRFYQVETGPGAGISTYGLYLTTWDGSAHQLTSPANSAQDQYGTPLSFDAVDNSGYHVELSDSDDGVVTDRQGNRYQLSGQWVNFCGQAVSSAVFTWNGSARSPDPYLGVGTLTPEALNLGNSPNDIRGGFGAFTLIDGSRPAVPGEEPPGITTQGATTIRTCQQAARISSVTDVNGNAINTTWSTAPADTMRRPPEALTGSVATSDYSGCVSPSQDLPISAASISNYQGFGGAINQVKLCYANFPVQTNFSQSGVGQYQTSSASSGGVLPLLITTVVLSDAPNWTGTRWTFNYDNYLNVSDVRLPTGGSIHYNWTEISLPSCSDYTQVSRAVAARTINDNNGHSSTWTYTWGTFSNGAFANTVSDPLGNDTVHVFRAQDGGCMFYETSTREYQGTSTAGALLKQVDTTYSTPINFVPPAGGNGGFSGIFPVAIQTTIKQNNNNKVNLVTRSYDPGPGNGRPSFGNVVSEKVYDWGQGAPGPLLRETDRTYQWQVDTTGNFLAANLVDPPASVTVKDGNGCTMAKTSFGYDETPVTASGLGASQQLLAAPNAVRGNQTSVSKWILPAGVCSPATGIKVTGTASWYNSGELYQSTDPLGHSSTHSYDAAYFGAYSSKSCNALSQCVSGTYDLATGLLTSFTDANATQQAAGNTPGDAQHTSNYNYDAFSRLTSAQSPPDPGNSGARSQNTYTYSAPNVFPITVQRVRSITNNMSDSQTATYDGLGRAVKTQHVTPNGTATVDTGYDALSQVITVTNPYFSTSDPTYGVIQKQYDALGRVTQTTKQDGSMSVVDYSAGNCVTATDEAGKARRSCTDALGRLTEVDESQASALGTSGTATVAISGVLQHAPAMLSASGSRIASYAVTDGDHVYYIGSEQHVHQLYYNNQYWMDQDLTSATSGPRAASGSGLAGYTASDGQHIYYLASNQHVHHLIYANGWVDQDLTAFTSAPLASSSGGLAAYSISDGQHIYYVGSNQHIYQLNYAGAWIYQDLTAFTGAPLAASGTALSAYAISDGQHIYYEGSNQHIYQLYYGGSWIYQDLTAFTNAPLAASASSGLASYAISDGQHIYYVGSNQHVYQLYYGSSWMLQDLTLFTSAPLAASGSGLASYAASDGQHIDYVGSDQNIYQLYWNNQAWLFQNVTSIAGAPAASSSSGLTALALSDGQHIFYVAGDQHLNQLYWNNQTWLNQDLSVMASFSVNDSGLVSLNVGSFTATACFGPSTNTACTGQPVNHTTSDVATALAQILNGANSPVTATVAGSTLNLIWKAPGPFTPAVSGLSTGHDNPTLFPNASFTSPATSFSGGAGTSLTNGYTTLYSYDALGNLLTVNQKGDTTDQTKWRLRTFTYDSLSRLLTANNPESGQISYSYDNDGELLSKTSPQANQTGSLTTTVSYCYDALHRVTAKGYTSQSCPLTSPVATYTYDQGANGIGHLSSLTDQAGSASYSYDVLGRLSSEQRTITSVSPSVSKSVSYEYNLNGSVKTLTYPSGAIVTYTPDSAGRVLSAVDSSNNINYVTGASYGPDSALTGFISGHSTSFNGITNTFSYSKRLQPVNMSASSPTQTVFSIGYDFHLGGGNNGNVWGITNYRETTRNQSFTYDALNRLTSAQNAGTDCTKSTVNSKTEYWGNNYSYDAWGNLLGKAVTKCSAENLSVTPDVKNQIHTGTPAAPNQACASSPDYLYDAAGNMTCNVSGGASPQSYTYDAENRITGAGGYTYIYDNDGNRAQKSNGATGTLYWYMTPGIVAESDLAGALKSEYVFFDGERAARRDLPGGAVSYYFSDHLKTASVITDSAGIIKAESDYYPWGGELQFVNNDTNHYKFTGKERDSESGLDYFGARYYANILGRWLSTDWAVKPASVPYAKFGDPQSLNLYTYVRNEPIIGIDADGHQCYGCHDKPKAVPSPSLSPPPRLVVNAGKPFLLDHGTVQGVVGVHYTPMQHNWLGGCPLSTCHTFNGLFPPLRPVYMTNVATLTPILILNTVGMAGAAAGRATQSTTEILQGAANRAAQTAGPGSGAAYGTAVHTEFAAEVRALGNPNLTTEQSYLNGANVRYGTPGSIRVDVVEGPVGAPTAVYDLKTGSATLSPERIQQIQSNLPPASGNIPVTEIKPQ